MAAKQSDLRFLRRLAVRDFPGEVQSEADAILGGLPTDVLTSRCQALQRVHSGPEMFMMPPSTRRVFCQNAFGSSDAEPAQTQAH